MNKNEASIYRLASRFLYFSGSKIFMVWQQKKKQK
ncbi:hypothetical protein ZPR_3720 [Zunongwangia profunda SM-A87]|uniref:Uncharacterized protein n=1 Tax=Zunongwangia profunda (strain DSM 18752 / CCTCC AB 206139 / SM-A87) TaxID=655815 RepID=D5BLA2_ZUNPS|nr:hypothetical protein ZPR_3720 [Zunongwangia profunda SM-A87]